MGVAFLLIVGTLLGNTQLFVMAAALAMLLIVACVLVSRSVRRITADISFPDLVCVGQQFDLTATVGGAGYMREGRYRLLADIPSEVRVDEELESDGEDSYSIRLKLAAEHRGAHDFGPLYMVVEDPLGLIVRRVLVGKSAELLAWPEPLDPGLSARENLSVSNTGSSETAERSEEGTSFHGVRQWSPGDLLRHVHWPSTTRLGELMVVEYEAEAADDVLIVLDCRAIKDGDGGAFETACSVVSYLLHQCWARRKRVRLLTSGSSPVIDSAQNVTAQEEMLAALARAWPDKDFDLSEVISRSFESGRPGSLVLVTGSADEEARGVLSRLCGAGGASILLAAPTGGSLAQSAASGHYGNYGVTKVAV